MKHLTLAGFILFLLLIGCENPLKLEEFPPGKYKQTKRVTTTGPGLQIAMEAQDKATHVLMAIEGVVGTGTGLDAQGKPVIVVFTESKGVAGIPAFVDNIPVKTKVTGRFVAYEVDPRARFTRPVPIGVSTGHPDITAGTIGCRVTDGTNFYALSNNHVFANSNNAVPGDNILQPGPYDGGTDPADAIGTLHDFEPMLYNGPENLMDAAIALVTPEMLGASTPEGVYGTPSSTTAVASIGLDVMKYGRTTRWTFGEVSEINVTVDVCYETRGPVKCVTFARFVDQFTITPGDFSDGGDSGSLIVTQNGNNPVGLLFAGSSSRTIANPIDVVLSRFEVTVDEGVDVNLSPTADFSYTTNDLDVTFTDLSADSDGSITAWDWSFGEGGTSTAQNPTYSYATYGTYPVTLTVTDNEGATDAKTLDVTVEEYVNTPPAADFSFSANYLDVDFTDLSSDNGSVTAWSWEFGDGGTATTQSPSHTYAEDGTYSVTLTVTDNEGATDAITQDVTVEAYVNTPPTADFSFVANQLTVDFTDLSSDNGSVTAWSWDFGDGNGSSIQSPSHTYAGDGTYSVTLTVTDNEGATDAITQDVTVIYVVDPIILTGVGYKVKGRQHVDLTWESISGTNVDIYRDGALEYNVPNSGSYTDAIGARGGGSYTYKVCAAGSDTECSSTITVVIE